MVNQEDVTTLRVSRKTADKVKELIKYGSWDEKIIQLIEGYEQGQNTNTKKEGS